jgi:hypothetical protein
MLKLYLEIKGAFMNQTIRIIGIVFSILFAIVSLLLNKKLKKDLTDSIEKDDKEIEKQIKKYLFFLGCLVLSVILFTIIILLI